MRYAYLGDRLSAPTLKGAKCDPVRRLDGKCVVGRGAQLVTFAGETAPRVVIRRRLRVTIENRTTSPLLRTAP